jgi:uncharacterized protein (UPF0332 family)
MSNNTTTSSRITQYLDDAHTTVSEIETLLEHNFLKAAVSRMYYACFYAVTALLMHKGIKVKSLSGAIQMMDVHYVKPGLLPIRMCQFYTLVHNSRIEGDYNPFAEFQHENVRQLYLQAVEFINTVDELLVKLGAIQRDGNNREG